MLPEFLSVGEHFPTRACLDVTVIDVHVPKEVSEFLEGLPADPTAAFLPGLPLMNFDVLHELPAGLKAKQTQVAHEDLS